jgi:hypothetical protein
MKVADGKPDADVMVPLRRHFPDFVATYNFGRRLKILKGFTPFE